MPRKIREVAAVAPKTVTKVSTGEVKPRRRRAPARTLATPVVVDVKADRDVWQHARQLAGGDVRRLVVVDRHTVDVVNQPR